jgi:4-hydroxybenzoate polyprenyltransferase
MEAEKRVAAISTPESFLGIKDYIKVARPDHWFKNMFMVPGILLAIAQYDLPMSVALLLKCTLAMFLACLMSSGNYVINEIYDAQFDRRHPNKRFRSVAAEKVSIRNLLVIDFFLIAAALFCSYAFFNKQFALTMLLFFVIGGLFYNIPPIRTKDLPLVDVLGESINNPLRLCLGWFAFVDSFDMPVTVLIGYWAFGAALVTAKRLAEFRQFGSTLVRYRPTFRYYSKSSLIFLYGVFAVATMLALFELAWNYNSRLFLTLPLMGIFFIWFSILTFQQNSIVKDPERIFEKVLFAIYCFVSLFVFGIILLY